MKRIIFFIAFLCLGAFNTYAQCFNGDVEANNFTNWQLWTGINANGILNLASFTPGFVAGRHTITNAGGFDPIVGAIPVVAEGNHAIKLGNSNTNDSAEIIAHTFTVTSALANFSFRYALVLQDGGHTPDPITHAPRNPFFIYWVSRSNNLTASILPGNLMTGRQMIADPLDHFFQHSGIDIEYKNWQTECIDLSGFIGEQVTIYFATADCTGGVHFGYAYIDGLCTPNDAVPSFTIPDFICSYTDLVANASASQNVTDLYWRMEKLNSNDPNDIIPGTDLGTYSFNTLPPSAFDLYHMYTNLGGQVTNGFYKITLGVRSCNGVFHEISKVIEVELPVLTAQNISRCCSAPDAVQLVAATPDMGGGITSSFFWYDEAGNFIGNGTSAPFTFAGFPWWSNTQAAPGTGNGKYRVVVVNSNGCSNEAYMYVVNRPSELSMLVTPDNCVQSCRMPTKLTAQAFYLFGEGSCARSSDFYYNMATDPSLLTYSWNTGETTPTINVQAGIDTYTVTATNGCASKTVTVKMSQYANVINGPFPAVGGANGQIEWTTGVHLGVTNFVAREHGMAKGAYPAYKATTFNLKILDRGGHVIREILGPSATFYLYSYPTNYLPDGRCEGLHNWDIFWDGKDNSGANVPAPATYFFELFLYNCKGDKQLYKGDITVDQ